MLWPHSYSHHPQANNTRACEGIRVCFLSSCAGEILPWTDLALLRPQCCCSPFTGHQRARVWIGISHSGPDLNHTKVNGKKLPLTINKSMIGSITHIETNLSVFSIKATSNIPYGTRTGPQIGHNKNRQSLCLS